jgi:hypothetical protein
VPFIVGVGAPAPEPGERWPERSVTDAVRIVRRLNASEEVRRRIHITAVDVSNYKGRRNPSESEFLVLAEGNCVIAWGRAPGTDQVGELPVDEKVAKLERYLREGLPTTNRTLALRFAGRRVVSRRFHADGNSN